MCREMTRVANLKDGMVKRVVEAYLKLSVVEVEADSVKKISLQEALDRGMFGPVWHGTSETKRDKIEQEGFKVFVGDYRSEGVSHGYEHSDYYDNIPAPVHHLGFGIYFTTSKTIAKMFSGGTTKGMKTYYLDVPRLETINFGSPRTMMKWWIQNGYDPKIAKTDRVIATQIMTNQIKSKWDAVWFKGKGLHKLLDGDQICVYDPSRIYQIDNSLAKRGDVGSKVRRKTDGMVGVIVKKRTIPETARDIHHGEKEFLEVKWKIGGRDYNVYPKDVDFI